jgi:hypothetical protein
MPLIGHTRAVAAAVVEQTKATKTNKPLGVVGFSQGERRPQVHIQVAPDLTIQVTGVVVVVVVVAAGEEMVKLRVEV